MEKSVWIKQLVENEQYIAENVLAPGSVWPTPVVKAYHDLIFFMMEGNVYGALLQVRDLYETILKIPVLATLIYICGTNKENILNDADLLGKWVGKTLSIGDWEALAAGLINKNNVKKYSLPEILVNILRKTRKLINKKISFHYPNISNWRNEVFGHGALQFEDSKDYQEAFPGLMTNLKDYFEGNGKDFRDCEHVYEKIIFQCDEINLQGLQGLHGYELDVEGNVSLKVDGLTVDVGAFVQMKSFFFSSFYYKKGTVKFLDYNSGRNLMKRDTELNEYITAFREIDKHQKKKFASSIVRREEERHLSMLAQPQGYIPPEYIFQQINKFMEEKKNGIIMLCMERGMGKTAFANRLDSLYHDSSASLIEDTVIRSYPLGSANLRGINDFINAINTIFTQSFESAQDFRFSGVLKPEIDVCENSPSEALANALNIYQEIYSLEFGIYNLMLILDGIDEVTVNTGGLLEYLPASELLHEGVYIICTSRLENEKTVAVTAKKNIREVARKSDLCIEVKRDGIENRNLLEDYIRQEMPDLDQETMSKLIEHSDQRILYLKVRMALYKSSIQVGEESLANERIALTYIHLLLNKYNVQAKALFRKTAAAICFLGPVTIRDYFEYISGDELNYGFVGALNDLLPILTVRGSDYGREYMLANEIYSMVLAEEFRAEIVDLINNIKLTFLNEFFPDESQSEVVNYLDDYSTEQLLEPEESLRLSMERYTKDKIFWIFTIQKAINFASQHGFEDEFLNEEFVNCVLLFLNMYMVNSRLSIGYIQAVIDEAKKTALNILMIIATKGININFAGSLTCGGFGRELCMTEGYDTLIDIVFNENVEQDVIAQWISVFFSMDLDYDAKPTSFYIEDKKLIDSINRNNLLKSVVGLLTPNGSITYLSYLLYMASLNLEKDLKEIVINMIVWSYLSDDDLCNEDEAKKWLSKIKEDGLNILYPENDYIRDRIRRCINKKDMDTPQDMEKLFSQFLCVDVEISGSTFAQIENLLSDENIVNKEAVLRELKKCYDVMNSIFEEGILPENIWSKEKREEYYEQLFEGTLRRDEISVDEYLEQYKYTILNNCRCFLKYLHLIYGSFTGTVLERWIVSLDDCLEKHSDEASFSKLNKVIYSLYFAVIKYYSNNISKKLLYLSRYVEKYDAGCYQRLKFIMFDTSILRNIVLPTEPAISLMLGYQDAGMKQEAEQLCKKIVAGCAEFEKNVLDRPQQNKQFISTIYYLNLYCYIRVSRKIGFDAIVNGIQFDFRRELEELKEIIRKINKFSNLFDVQYRVNMIISFFRETGIKDITRDKVFFEMKEIVSEKMMSADEETIKAMEALLEEINNANEEMNV